MNKDSRLKQYYLNYDAKKSFNRFYLLYNPGRGFNNYLQQYWDSL